MGITSSSREGISISHPARFILVGTMKPEEGDLRPQLLDRNALSVEIHGIRSARERVQIKEKTCASKATLISSARATSQRKRTLREDRRGA